ncbi:MAG: Hpt domain-containing protein [Bdellovibrionales bacterium]
MREQYLSEEQINTITDGDIEFKKELISMYIEDCKKRFENILKVCSTKDQLDFKQLEIEYHTLKGASLNIGALKLKEIAQALESFAINKDAKSILKTNSELGQALEMTINYLQEN